MSRVSDVAGSRFPLFSRIIHSFRNRKAEEVVGGSLPSLLLKPLTPAALQPTM